MSDSQRRRYQRLFRLGDRQSSEEQMDEELDTHLALRTADLIAAGLDPAAARAEAIRRFGGSLDRTRRLLRRGARRRDRARGARLKLEALATDVRLALRHWRRSPAFTLVTILTFALGIGITTATFTLVRSILLRPLPFPDPDRLMVLSGVDSLHRNVPVVSSGNWLDWRRESRSLAGTALELDKRYAIAAGGVPRRVPTGLVSGDFFRVIGSPFAAGRPFTEELVAADDRIAAVSERLWRSLGADRFPAPLTVESIRYRIIGVVRSGTEYPAGTDLWIPLRFEPETGAMRNNINWTAIARLRTGVSAAAAQADLSLIADGIRRRDPVALYSYGVNVTPLKRVVVGDAATHLALLMTAVLVVLLIACTNLSAAHLARELGRSRETAVRQALGAGRPRLLQQTLVEHTLLGTIGGALGFGLAVLAVRLFVLHWSGELPRIGEIRLDPWVVAFAAGISLGSSLATGLVAGRQAAAPELVGLVAAGGRSQVRGGRGLPGGALLVAEVALSLVLLAGAGLTIRTLGVLIGRDLGFDPDVVTVDATLSNDRYLHSPDRTVAFWDRLIASLEATPGIALAGVSNWIPLENAGTSAVEVEHGTGHCAEAGYRVVSEHYHRALAIPLMAGREFGPTDGATTERVALINRRAAAECWPGQDPIGKRLKAPSFEAWPNGGTAPWITVVGVVGDLRQWGPDSDPGAEVYVLFRQIPTYAFGMTAVVRGSGPAARLTGPVGDVARGIDPSVALEVGTLEQTLADRLSPRRLVMTVLSGFGGLALLLTAIGLYGLLSYSVSQRGREIALRAALGAGRADLLRTVVADGMRLVLAGVGLGLGAAAIATRFMGSVLVGVVPLDLRAFGAAVAILLGAAIVAILIPAIRGIRLDPTTVLQAD
jgi:predicted permease